jgi:CRP/FNR family transcriptional regulator, dissimilatory nitrate respiration regulator
MSSLSFLPVDVQQRASVRELAAGETLFRQGDPAAAIFEVEQGRVRLLRYTSETHPVVLHTARTGDLFAEAALFASTYHCDGVAAIDSRVRIYPKTALLAALRSDTAVGERFMALLAHEIHALRTRLEERNIRSARDRVLHHFALVAGKDGRTVLLDGTLMDLAAEIGLAHEVLYRTLAELEKAGVIARAGSQITLQRAAGA